MPKVDEAPKPSERLAINIFDLMGKVSATVRDALQLPKMLNRDRDSVIRVDEERTDETAVPFTCSLLTAAAVCDTLRNHDRECGDAPTRVYIQKGARAWERLPNHAVLTLARDGKVRLNPKWFDVRFEAKPLEE